MKTRVRWLAGLLFLASLMGTAVAFAVPSECETGWVHVANQPATCVANGLRGYAAGGRTNQDTHVLHVWAEGQPQSNVHSCWGSALLATNKECETLSHTNGSTIKRVCTHPIVKVKAGCHDTAG